MFGGKKKVVEKAPEGPKFPPKAELESLYASLLEDLAIPEAKRAAMISSESDEKKWMLIQAHKKMENSKTGKNIKTTEPLYWVGLLEAVDEKGVPTIRAEQAQEFETVLRTGHKQFLKDFVENDGVKSMLSLTSYYSVRSPMTDEERLILQRLMESYKWLMNNQVGMVGMMKHPDSLTTLALAMQLGGHIGNEKFKPNLVSAKEAVLLLAVTCFYSAKGRNMVVAAMDETRRRWRETMRYQSLVQTFISAKEDNEFRAACAMFITTIVNSAASCEARVKVRADFIALDILSAFRKVIKECEAEPDEFTATITTQYQVFEDMMLADQQEMVHDMINGNGSLEDGYAGFSGNASAPGMIQLDNTHQIYKATWAAASANGTVDFLLEVLQGLLLIPQDRSVSAHTWEAISTFVHEAAANCILGSRRTSKQVSATSAASVKVLHELLDERLKLDAKMMSLTGTDEIVNRQRLKIEELTAQLNAPKSGQDSEKTKALEEEVKLLRSKNDELLQQIEGLKANLFEEQKKVSGLQEQLKEAKSAPKPAAAAAVPAAAAASATPAAPAASGIPANVDEKYMKYYRMKKAGLPEGAIMNAFMRDNVPVPPNFFDGGDVAAPAAAVAAISTGAATANKAAGGVANVAGGGGANNNTAAQPAAPKGPQKPVIKPNVKMRGLFWTKIQPENMQGTIWVDVKDDKVKLDIPVLEAKFQAVETKAVAGAGGTGGGAGGKEKVHIVDGKRQQNVGIAISKIRATPQDTIKAIITLDETNLPLERTKVLVDMAPTDDEISMLRGYDGDLDLLTTEDRFLYELTNVPRLQIRLKSLVVKYTFESDAKDIKTKLIYVKDACVEIEKNKNLKTLMEIVLAIGNYLNGSTPRGGAWGFKLDALEKLEAVKENEGKKSLIHYIIYILEKHYPGVLETFDLPNCEHAINVSISETHSDLRNLSTQVRMIKTELAADHSDKQDRFVNTFSSFQLKAEKIVQELETEFQFVLEDFQKLGERFAETGGKLEPGTFFGNFVKFKTAIKQAYAQLLAAREKEDKLNKLEAEKQKRMTLHKAKEDAGLVDQFQKANQGDASDIVEGFRQRHRASLDNSDPTAKEAVAGANGGDVPQKPKKPKAKA